MDEQEALRRERERADQLGWFGLCLALGAAVLGLCSIAMRIAG